MELTVQTRNILGRKVKNLRRGGLIPAELYGHDFPNIHLAVSQKDFLKIFHQAGESTLIRLKISAKGGGEKSKDDSDLNVLVYNVQKDYLTGEVAHIDFYKVRMDEKIKTAVPLELVGESPGVVAGGILVKAMQEIEIEALPQDLPRNIEVQIAGLSNIGDSLYVKDIRVPTGVKILVEPETVIATVSEPAKEEAPEAVSVEEVKVESEEKSANEAEGGKDKNEG